MSPTVRKIAFVLIIVLCNVLVIEMLAYAFGTWFLGNKGIVYVDAIPDEDSLLEYLERRDPVLGWPQPSSYGRGHLDELGGRVNTFFPDTGSTPCVSTYGDSFTYSMEVDDTSAYPNQLSRILGCRVNNFGAIGYGTDQAVIRFRRNERDRPRVAILAHTSEDIIRNVNQFAGLLYGGRFGFKPRFVVTNDATLELEPILDLDRVDRADFYENPAGYLQHDYFVPGGPSGIAFLKFPYSVAVARSLFSYKFEGFFDDAKPYTEPFYDVTHPSNSFTVTRLIIEEFKAEAVGRDIVPLVVIVPIVVDLLDRQATGSWPYRNLVSYLENDSGIDYVDFGEVLYQVIHRNGQTVCDYYRRVWYAKGGCTGHFNEDGYLLLAETLASKIESMRLSASGTVD